MRMRRRSLVALFFVSPAFLLHLSIVTFPSFSTVFMSLYDWNGLGNAKFIGLMNYVNIFITDKVIGPAALNNVKWALIFITLPIIIALPVASMLRKVKYGQMVYRTFFFLPYVVAAAITGRIFATYYNPIYGIGKLFSALGITSSLRLDLLGNPKLALYAIAFADNWHWWGFVMVLLIAALHQVDAGLYESARVEGANKWQEFIHITIPGIRPTLFFLIMMTIIWSFLQFDYIWVMTKGGPAQSTEIISTWMYKNAFINYKAGYANAICVLQSFVCIFVYLLLKIIQKKGWDV